MATPYVSLQTSPPVSAEELGHGLPAAGLPGAAGGLVAAAAGGLVLASCARLGDGGGKLWEIPRENYGKTIGKWEIPRKTMGKP